MKVKVFLAMVLGILPISATYASDHIPQAVFDTANKLFPGFTIENAGLSPIPGLYRIAYGLKVVYMSADGRYVVRGDVIDITQGKNLTEDVR